MFDRYVGLGLNCEVVVQLRRLSGCPQANVFDWQYLSQEALTHTLRTDFADYFLLPNMTLAEDRRHVVDTTREVQFHHLFTPNLDGTIMPQRIAREYPKVRARADHLVERWRETVASSFAVLYVQRDPCDELTVDDVVSLRDVLRECYPAHRFAVLWARDPVVPGVADLGDEVAELADGVYVAGIPVAQPRLVLWRGDNVAWDRVFPKLRDLRPYSVNALSVEAA
jgi:hypothetical protein